MSSFSSLLKDELVELELNEIEAKAMLKGLLQVNASINISSTGLYLEFKSKNLKVAQKVYDLILEFYKLEPFMLQTKETKLNKDDVYITRLEQNAYHVLDDLKVLSAKDDSSYNLKKELLSDEEKLSYLRGAFLACGSINDPKSNTYHLEIQTFSSFVGFNLRDLMNLYGLNAKISQNRRGYIVYLKSADKISDFIRILGSNDELFYFEDCRIEKDLANSINRVMNCEIANQKKTLETAKRQLEEIGLVEKFYGSKLKDSLKEVIMLRRAYPEESLSELETKSTEVLGKNISKAAINHRLREIHDLKEKISSN